MGGRVSDFAVVGEAARRRSTSASAPAACSRPANQGTTWSAVFEKEAVASVGAIAVWQKNPDVVWAGTGEANSRNSSSWGNGVYRSRDGGGTWEPPRARQHPRRSAASSPIPTDSNTVLTSRPSAACGARTRSAACSRPSDGGTHLDATCSRSTRRPARATWRWIRAAHRRSTRAMYARRRTPWSYTVGRDDRRHLPHRATAGARGRSSPTACRSETGPHRARSTPPGPAQWCSRWSSRTRAARSTHFDDKSRAGGVFRSEDGGDHWIALEPFSAAPVLLQPDPRPARRLEPRLPAGHRPVDLGRRRPHVSAPAAPRTCTPTATRCGSHPANGDHVRARHRRRHVPEPRPRRDLGLHQQPRGRRVLQPRASTCRDPYCIYGGLQDNQTWGGPSQTRFEPEPVASTRPGAQRHLQRRLVLPRRRRRLPRRGGSDRSRHRLLRVAGRRTCSRAEPRDRQASAPAALRRARASRCSASTGTRRSQISPHDPSRAVARRQPPVPALRARRPAGRRRAPISPPRTPTSMVTGGSVGRDALHDRHAGRVADEGRRDLGRYRRRQGVGDARTREATGATSPRTCSGVPAGLYVGGIEASHHDAEHRVRLRWTGTAANDFEPYLFVTRDFGKSWTSIAGDLPQARDRQVVREDPQNPQLAVRRHRVRDLHLARRRRHWQKLGDGLADRGGRRHPSSTRASATS